MKYAQAATILIAKAALQSCVWRTLEDRLRPVDEFGQSAHNPLGLWPRHYSRLTQQTLVTAVQHLGLLEVQTELEVQRSLGQQGGKVFAQFIARRHHIAWGVGLGAPRIDKQRHKGLRNVDLEVIRAVVWHH